MTRTMYDSVDYNAIPHDAQMVAGYIDGHYKWPESAWARFPHAVHVQIAVFSTTQAGHVLDVEKGNASPQEAVGWVQRRREQGADPTVYCDLSIYPEVRKEFLAHGVAMPHIWLAHWDEKPLIGQGTIAKQYHHQSEYDTSVVADFWPGVDKKNTRRVVLELTPEQEQMISHFMSWMKLWVD
jgi:hypothetical protein